jgi:hypothetical protein
MTGSVSGDAVKVLILFGHEYAAGRGQMIYDRFAIKQGIQITEEGT